MIADPHDIRKAAIEDEIIKASFDRHYVGSKAYEAFWQHWQSIGLVQIIIPYNDLTQGHREAWQKVGEAAVKACHESAS